MKIRPSSPPLTLSARVPDDCAGMRLDQVLATLFPQYSRSRLQAWIKDGRVTVDAAALRPRVKLAGGETVCIAAAQAEEGPWQAEAMPLRMVYDDAALIVVDKPAGLVVHPAAGHRHGTLVNALLHHAPELSRVPRAGIVHRLDKDTTGLMVVARTLESHAYLVGEIQARRVRREYLALVYGELAAGGRVAAPVGRHPVQRQRMAVTAAGKEAATEYRVLERFHGFTLVRAILETGRTHQIRVHMAHLRHPVVGDPVYGRLRLPKDAGEALRGLLRGFKRQALHAECLSLVHPTRAETLQWRAAPPPDLQDLLGELRERYVLRG